MSMDILVHAEGFHPSEATKELVMEKVARLLHYAPRALRARVTLRLESPHPSPQQFLASVLIEVPGRDVSASQHAGEPMEAVDLLVEKVEHQLQRKKTAKLSRRVQAPAWRAIEATA